MKLLNDLEKVKPIVEELFNHFDLKWTLGKVDDSQNKLGCEPVYEIIFGHGESKYSIFYIFPDTTYSLERIVYYPGSREGGITPCSDTIQTKICTSLFDSCVGALHKHVSEELAHATTDARLKLFEDGNT